MITKLKLRISYQLDTKGTVRDIVSLRLSYVNQNKLFPIPPLTKAPLKKNNTDRHFHGVNCGASTTSGVGVVASFTVASRDFVVRRTGAGQSRTAPVAPSVALVGRERRRGVPARAGTKPRGAFRMHRARREAGVFPNIAAKCLRG